MTCVSLRSGSASSGMCRSDHHPAAAAASRSAFVDAVSTLPSRENQGYGSATMQRLAETLGDKLIERPMKRYGVGGRQRTLGFARG